MGHYPVFVDLSERRCVVIGGGPVAERKVEGLLAAGAAVTVISPGLTAHQEALAEEGRIRHVRREYGPGDLAGSELAFAATDDGGVNAAVAREGRERGVWVNVADDPVHGDFIVPSVLRRGDLVVAVGTGGASPALSRAIRAELEAYFTEEHAVLAEVVAGVRRELRQGSNTPDPEAWCSALDDELRRLVTEGNPARARARLLRRLGAETRGEARRL